MKLLLDLKLRFQHSVEVTISVIYDVVVFVMLAMYLVFCVHIFVHGKLNNNMGYLIPFQ